MPLHTYIQEYFTKNPEARVKGVQNQPIIKRPKMYKVEKVSAKNGETNIPIRIYTPILEEHEIEHDYPIFIYLHDGGYTNNGFETHDISCRLISSLCGFKVITMDYELGNQKIYNTIQDCYASVNWIINHAQNYGGRSDDISIGGASIGAYFASVITLKALITGDFNLTKQVLHYPIIDLNETIQNSPYLSRKMYNAKYGVDLTTHQTHLIQDEQIEHLKTSPLNMKQTDLAKMPKTLLFTSEYDPFCDEGELFADKLKEAGTLVKLIRFDGNIHGFMQNFLGSPDYMRGHELTAEFLANE